MSEGATYLVVHDQHDGWWRIDPSESERLETEMQRYLETQQDRLIELRQVFGAVWHTPVSDIRNFWLCTPEVRRRIRELDRAIAEEDGPDWQKGESAANPEMM